MKTSIPGEVNSCPNQLTGVPAHLYLTLISTLFAKNSLLGNKDSYPTDWSENLQDGETFDFIVVGSGSAGSVVASRLSEDGKWKVLLLEVGGYPSATTDIPILFHSTQETEEDWQYKTEPSETSFLSIKNRQNNWAKGKVLGGSSSINAMMYVRGTSKDFDQWAEFGNPNWGFQDVLPAFHKIEKTMFPRRNVTTSFLSREKGPDNFRNSLLEAANELSSSSSKYLGYFETPMTIHKGTRSNAAKMFLGKAKTRKNLKLSLHSYVEKIIIKNKKATGVEVRIGDTKLKIFAEKEVIISAGSISSPQLLMLSGIGPKKHLKRLGIEPIQTLDVGQNLQDHVMFPLYVVRLPDHDAAPFIQEDVLDDLYEYIMHRTGTFSELYMTNLTGFINTKNNSKFPDIQYIHYLSPKGSKPDLVIKSNYDPEIVKTVLKLNRDSNLMFIFTILIKPKSMGDVMLKTKDPSDHPKIFSNFFSDKNDEDFESVLNGIKFLENLIKHPKITDYFQDILDVGITNCKSHAFRSDSYWKCAIRNTATTIFHPVGTCKMGTENDKSSVVDHRLRVRGIKNLRVIDGSIMPTITSGGTNAPILMIGEKGATMILEDHRTAKEEPRKEL